MQSEKPIIHLELTIDEINLILTALGQLPYVQVAGMMENIRKQAAGQWAVKTEMNNQK